MSDDATRELARALRAYLEATADLDGLDWRETIVDRRVRRQRSIRLQARNVLGLLIEEMEATP